ncbi:beta-catenin-like protein 1 [Klebsormidium nitens]|uniref:Beta-catenin-like protein 1 n=1 Tax=Klebsormidium nitens TaxID=105231 RepID=A0A1Y1HQW2_KLENI|nr:beta-catenin-like protein 1 [Klebsormidium nitens]|eukprot:GAQ81024.1 beta-catenin-like protein 1 [Klebsormidium nitens]
MAEPSRKRPSRFDADGERSTTRARPNGIELSNGAHGEDDVDMALLEAAEKEAGQGVETLDARTLKRMVLSFEKRVTENLEARMKYADAPEKFVGSEVDLDEEVKKLHALSAAPELYPELVRLNVVPSLVGLLSHENVDISTDVIDVIKDLTDSDALEESSEEAQVLVDALLDNNVLELLTQNLSRLDESSPDEASAVYSTLGIVENLVEVSPPVAEMVCERTKLLAWLLNRLKGREADGNKLYSSEILAILMQESSVNQKKLGQMNGIDVLLKAVAAFKSRDPRTTDEEEMLENLYDVLCSVLLPDENKERFVASEGVELMIIVIRQKRQAYASAFKTLDFALTRCPTACDRFVNVQGLKTLFAAFMAKGLPKSKKKDQSPDEIDERAVSLIASLLGNVTRGSLRDRILSKFVEREYEKVDRLMELFIKYQGRVEEEEGRQQNLPADLQEDLSDEERYLAKLGAGLYTLQLLALIAGSIWATDHRGMRERLLLLLHQQGLTLEVIRRVLQEYHDNIGDVEGQHERDKRRSRVQRFMKAMTPKELEQDPFGISELT